MATPRKPAGETIYQLKVTLKGIRPPVWRRFQVASDTSLDELHEVIQIVMGWYNCHLYMFKIGDTPYSDPDPDWGFDVQDSTGTNLSQVVRGASRKFLYEYDMGDGWEHEILVEKTLPTVPGQHYPVCVTGRRACPPEDCGGVWGYAELLEIIKDPEHKEYEDRMEWLGRDFNPAAFDADEVNELLRGASSQGVQINSNGDDLS